MNKPRFIVIENKPHVAYVRAQLLVTLGYSRDRIWPPVDTQVVKSWDEALNAIFSLRSQGWDPKDCECYLLCDLALDDANVSTEEGIAQLYNTREQLRDYIVIAVTGYAGRAYRLLGSGADQVLDSSMLEGPSGKHVLHLTLQSARNTWALRTSREIIPIPAPYTMPDSPGVRALLAAVPKEVITLLAKLECPGWTDMTIHALTGGYSGAHIIRIEGRDDEAPRSVICKITRRSEVLAAEAERTKRALESYKIYVGRIAPYVEMTPKALLSEGWYSVQSSVPGETLERALLSADDGDGRVHDFLDELGEMLDLIDPTSVRPRPVVAALKMLDVDIERFVTSLPALMAVAARCDGLGLLSGSPLTTATVSELQRLVSAWNDTVAERFPVAPQYEQHGDFNPRNVLLASGRFQLIDFARFGYWPAAYDLIRMEQQLLLRGVDRMDELDAFPDRLPQWLALSAAVEAEAASITLPAGREEAVADKQLATLFQHLRRLTTLRRKLLARLVPDVKGPDMSRLLALQRAFDAIKICSYQDASVFKRLWFLHIAAANARTANVL
jgi:CheY-like chemotaxis protein